MEKIERLGWAAGFSFETFGLKIGLRVSDSSMLDAFVARIPPDWAPLEDQIVDRLYSVVTPALFRRHSRQFSILYGDDARLARTERSDELLDIFESDLDLYLAANCQRPLFVHAGAVKWHRHVILMPGPSRSGKTSLVAEFLKAGATYYSDDLALVDHSGFIHSFPRPLSVRVDGGAIQKIAPERIGTKLAEPGTVSFVLFTEYDSACSWSPQRVSHGQGMLRLLQNTPSARMQPGLAMDVLGDAIKNAEIHVGFRGEKAQTVRRVLNYLEHWSLS